MRPSKARGQNFVHDPGTVRRIVRDAGVRPGDAVVEIGPGLGSLTLALLEAGAFVSAVEVDPRLAAALLPTVRARMPEAAGRAAVAAMDAMRIAGAQDLAVPPAFESPLGPTGPFLPAKLVANLPYNLAVPLLLTLFDALPCAETATVMVQAEVADRLAAAPGSRTYGAPSAKVAWYSDARRGAKIGRSVFWPVPNVDSALVSFIRLQAASPATRSLPSSTRPSLSGARRCDRPSPPGRDRRPGPKAPSDRPGSTRPCAARGCGSRTSPPSPPPAAAKR